MMLLLFQLDRNLYAIDTAEVVEIVPMMLLAKVPAAPDHIAGVFNYRGNIVPIVDLCQLIQGTPCQTCYSTRVVIVNYTASSPVEFDRNLASQQLGLMAERVTETLKVDSSHVSGAKQISTVPYLGNLFVDEKGMIQQVHWQHFISEAHQAILFARSKDRANDAERN